MTSSCCRGCRRERVSAQCRSGAAEGRRATHVGKDAPARDRHDVRQVERDGAHRKHGVDGRLRDKVQGAEQERKDDEAPDGPQRRPRDGRQATEQAAIRQQPVARDLEHAPAVGVQRDVHAHASRRADERPQKQGAGLADADVQDLRRGGRDWSECWSRARSARSRGRAAQGTRTSRNASPLTPGSWSSGGEANRRTMLSWKKGCCCVSVGRRARASNEERADSRRVRGRQSLLRRPSARQGRPWRPA